MSTSSAPAAAGRGAAAGRCPEPTKARLLDCAEQLFATRGFAGASMRALAELAGTSVSTAHYHFGSKRALVRAVLLRRLEPMNRERLARLAKLEEQHAPGPPPLEDVLDAFLRPSFEAWERAEVPGLGPFRQVLAQLHGEPDRGIAALRAEVFGPLVDRFVEVLARVLPNRSPAELRLDLQLVVGLLVQVVGGHVPEPPEGLAREALLAHVLAFAAAGLRAKSAAPPRWPQSTGGQS